MVRSISALAVAWGLWATNGVQAQEPPRLFNTIPNNVASEAPNVNQLLANNVAAQLRASGIASGADVNIIAMGGTVELSGTVRDAQQKAQIERVVSSVPGVTGGVRNQLVLEGQQVPNGQLMSNQPIPNGQPIPGIPIEGAPNGVQGGPIGGPVPGQFVNGPHGDPVPLVPPQAPGYNMNPPKLPPYAWPTYAPHNNFSRVAYPTTYPYNAWPYIGPFYPFPKVPLGWRKITLEWEDGHWYYGKTATPQDYWRVRYW